MGGPNGFAGACLRRIRESRDRRAFTKFYLVKALRSTIDARRKNEKKTRVGKKGPSSAVENRKRFRRQTVKRKILDLFFCPPFRFTARRANLMNGFAGACLKFLFPLPRRGRGKKHVNRKDGGPLRFLWNLRGLRKKDQKSEERPSPQIPLESEGTPESFFSLRAPISDRGPAFFIRSEMAFLSDIFPDSGSPQIPLESEGTAVLPIRVFFSSAPAGQRE